MQRFLAVVLTVCSMASSLLAKEWVEFRAIPCASEVKAWDISYDGSAVALVTVDQNAWLVVVPKDTRKDLKPKALQRWASSVVMAPEMHGDFTVLGANSGRYDYGGKKEAEVRLGTRDVVVGKTAKHFIAEYLFPDGKGWLHTWSYSRRLGAIPWKKGNKVVVAATESHLITWDQRMLTAYTDSFRNRESKRGTEKAPPRPPSEWTWFKRGPVLEEAVALDCSHDGKVVLLALRGGRVLARLPEGDKTDSDLLGEYKQKYGNDWPYAKPLMLESLTTSSSPESEGLKNTAGAVSPKGEWIAVAKEVESRGQVFVWHNGGVPVMLGPLEVPATQLQFIDDGRLVSAAGNELAVWSLASGTVQRINLLRPVKNFVVSGDGKTIAVLGHDGKEDGIVLFREKDAPTVTSK